MLIQQERIRLPKEPTKENNFIIAHITVPDHLSGLRIKLLAETSLLDCVLIYDPTYQLRGEITESQGLDMVVIHEEEILSSLSAKAGEIPAGEWLIAFELTDQNRDRTWEFSYQVEGMKADAMANR